MDYQQKQAFKEKATIAGIGVVAGGVAWWIILASVFGWVSPSTMQQHTSDAVQAKVDKVLAPFCADKLMADKPLLAKFIAASKGYDRTEIVQNDIAKIGTTHVDYQLSDACATTVQARIKKAAPTVAINTLKKKS
jgi:hypothetical protein